jgi:hypothetical protein
MNNHSQSMQQQLQREAKSLPATVMQVITNPAGFFGQMPKSGGYLPPLIFMVFVAIVSGFLLTILALLGLGRGGVLTGLAAVVMMPLMMAIFSFLGAAILFIFWKILGSGESFETAYRCSAYASAIMPITAVLRAVPYLGSVLGLVWMTYLMVVASTEVHGIAVKKARIAFGIVGGLLILSTLSAEITGRKMMHEMKT